MSETTVDDAKSMFEITKRNESILISPVTRVRSDASSIKNCNAYHADKTQQMEVASKDNYHVQCRDGSRTPVYSVPERK